MKASEGVAPEREGGRAARAGLLGLVAGIPLVAVRTGGDPFGVPKLSFLLIGVGIISLVSLRRVRTRVGSLWTPVLAALIPVLLSWVVNGHKAWTWLGEYTRFQGLLSAVAFAALTILLGLYLQGESRRLAQAMAISASGVAAYALVQMFGFDPFTWSYSDFAASTVGHSNFAGASMAIGLPAIVGLWFAGRKTFFYRLAAILTALAIIGTFSQGAWGAALAGVTVTMGLCLRARYRWSAMAGFASAAMIALLNVGLVAASHLVGEGGRLYGSSVWARGLSWATALRIGSDHPVFGAGPNAFAYESSKYRDALEVIGERANDPHSIPLTYFADLGIVGVIGFVVIAVWVIRRSLRVSDPIGAGFAGGAVAYLTVSLVTVNELSLRGGVWACVVGLWLATSAAREGQMKIHEGGRRNGALRAVVAIGAGGAIVWGSGLVISDIAFGRATAALARGDLRSAQDNYATLLRMPGNHPHQRQVVGERAGEAALRAPVAAEGFWSLARRAHGSIESFPYVRYGGSSAYWLSQRSAFAPEWIDDALERWQRVTVLDPFDPDPQVQIAKLLVRSGAVSEAIAELEGYVESLRARDESLVARGAQDVLGMLSIAYLKGGDRTAALGALEVVMPSTRPTCHIQMARALLRMNDQEVKSGVRLSDVPATLRIGCDASSLALIVAP